MPRGDIADVDALEAFMAEARRSGRGMSGDALVIMGVPLVIWSQNAALNERFNGGRIGSSMRTGSAVQFVQWAYGDGQRMIAGGCGDDAPRSSKAPVS